MPFAKTWTEELIAELFSLEGYQVIIGLPVGTVKGKGGRMEADIVASRVRGEMLEVQHIEVGTLAGNVEDNYTGVQAKFSPQRKKEVENYAKAIFGTSLPVSYQCLYIASYVSEKQLKELPTRFGEVIRLQHLRDFLRDVVLPRISIYISQRRTIPEGSWLLALLQYVLWEEILSTPS